MLVNDDEVGPGGRAVRDDEDGKGDFDRDTVSFVGASGDAVNEKANGDDDAYSCCGAAVVAVERDEEDADVEDVVGDSFSVDVAVDAAAVDDDDGHNQHLCDPLARACYHCDFHLYLKDSPRSKLR